MRSRTRPASLSSNATRTRRQLIRLIALLVATLIAIKLAADPQTWAWLFPSEAVPSEPASASAALPAAVAAPLVLRRRRGRRSSSSHRVGSSRTEVLVVAAVVLLLTAILLPLIVHQREADRRVRCQDNLKDFGGAFQNYYDVWKSFPPLDMGFGEAMPSDSRGADWGLNGYYTMITSWHRMSGNSILNLEPWTDIERELAASPVPALICPASPASNPSVNAYLGSFNYPVGDRFGVTTYAYCKGVTDAWCGNPSEVPAGERGVFDVGSSCTTEQITDGLANTFVMGEATSGEPWTVCRGGGCVDAKETRWNPDGTLPPQPWIVGRINTDEDVRADYLAASLFACTRDALNKNPVTDTMRDGSALDDCRSSLNGGLHSTSNFRSDHTGGAQFLFADGSVRMISEKIGMETYRAMSTIADAEEDAAAAER